MPDIRYFEFDFKQGVVIEYERDGECNGCGECCRRVIRFKGETTGLGQDNPILGWDSRNGSLTLQSFDTVNALYVDGHWRYFGDVAVTDEIQPCPMLSAANKCRIHTGKTLLARAWPMSPRQVEAIKECSYSFREIGRWTTEEWYCA